MRVKNALSSKLPAPPAPQIRRAHFEDYSQIRCLEAVLNSRLSPDEWRMLWHGNPLWPQLGSWWPIGWVLEASAGEITGYVGNIPVLYHFRGERLVAAVGRAWIVAPSYRGRYSRWLVDARYSQPGVDLIISTTVGPMALRYIDKIANRVPAGDWETVAYRVTGYRSFGTRALQKLRVPFAVALGPFAGATLRLMDGVFGRKAAKHSSGFTIEATDRFDFRFDAFWRELLRQNGDTLLAARDRATLSWHFSEAMRRSRVWVLTASRSRQLRAYCIFKRQDIANELPRMRLVDYQTIEREIDPLPDLLAVALARCATEDISVLDKPGLGLAKMRAFDEFARYRRTQSWPFFYRATDRSLADTLRRPEVWDPSEYDGDASLE
jgi:hypothetical protein